MGRHAKSQPDGRFGLLIAQHILDAAGRAAAHRGLDLSSYVRLAIWDQLQRDGFAPEPPAEVPTKKAPSR